MFSLIEAINADVSHQNPFLIALTPLAFNTPLL